MGPWTSVIRSALRLRDRLLAGNAPPEGNVAAPVGATYIQRADPKRFWVKTSGTGKTGWVERPGGVADPDILG